MVLKDKSILSHKTNVNKTNFHLFFCKWPFFIWASRNYPYKNILSTLELHLFGGWPFPLRYVLSRFPAPMAFTNQLPFQLSISLTKSFIFRSFSPNLKPLPSIYSASPFKSSSKISKSQNPTTGTITAPLQAIKRK